MSTLGSRIQQARLALSQTQAELASKVGVSTQVLSSWERDVHTPRKPKLAELGAALGVSVAYLLGEDSNVVSPPVGEAATRPLGLFVALPLWTGILGAAPSDEATYERDGHMEIPSAFLIGGYENIDRHEMIRVSGSSMAPRIRSGESVIIFRDSTPRRNTIVLLVSPEGRAFLKVLREDNKGKFYADSINPEGAVFGDLTGWSLEGYAIYIRHDEPDGANIEWRDGDPLRA